MAMQFQNLTSAGDKIKELFGSPLSAVLFIVCVLLFAAIVCMIALLCVRYKVTYVIDKDERREKSFYRHSVIDQSAPPAREGFAFGGWFTDENCEERAPEALRATCKNIVLYALWEKSAETETEAAHSISEKEKASAEEVETEEEKQSEEMKTPAAESIAEGGETSAEEPENEKAEEKTEAAEEFAEPEEIDEEDAAEAGEGDEIDNAVVTTVAGSKVFVQYRRSFQARLIQADDEVKDLYNAVRNALLTTAGVKERVSWNYNSFNKGRKQFAKINANRRSLILYLALAPADMEEKYNFRDVSLKKRYKEVPVRYKITGSRSLNYALELIEKAAERNGFARQEYPFEQNLSFPYETREQLIGRRLIKVFAKKDTGEAVTEAQLEELIEEGATVESLSSFTVTDKISVTEAEKLVSDATAKQLIALAEEIADGAPRAPQAKRAYINLDTISLNFSEGETVTLASLKAKKLIDPKKSAVKVLARGSLDKALTVEASDFSLPAVKMIVLTGGKVVKLKKS